MNINNYVGVPFIMDGSSLSGCNCWTLLRIIYKNEFDIELPKFADEFAATKIEETKELGLLAELESQAHWVQSIAPKTGDCVLIRVRGSAYHVGMYIERGKVLHMLTNQPSLIERTTSNFIGKRIIGYYRHQSRA